MNAILLVAAGIAVAWVIDAVVNRARRIVALRAQARAENALQGSSPYRDRAPRLTHQWSLEQTRREVTEIVSFVRAVRPFMRAVRQIQGTMWWYSLPKRLSDVMARLETMKAMADAKTLGRAIKMEPGLAAEHIDWLSDRTRVEVAIVVWMVHRIRCHPLQDEAYARLWDEAELRLSRAFSLVGMDEVYRAANLEGEHAADDLRWLQSRFHREGRPRPPLTPMPSSGRRVLE